MAGTLYLDKKVGDLKLWELYMGFVILQLLIGIVIAFIQGVFDLTGIRGALSQIVKQLSVVMNVRKPEEYLGPIAGEIKEGKYL